jgi:hypothetical protein
MVVLGSFGENVGLDFRERMSSTLRREIEFQVELLATLTDPGQAGHYVLTDDERDDMVRFKDMFEFIHKKSRKGPSLWKWAANAGPAARESE